jgi:hypothetical protein
MASKPSEKYTAPIRPTQQKQAQAAPDLSAVRPARPQVLGVLSDFHTCTYPEPNKSPGKVSGYTQTALPVYTWE